MMTPLEMRRGGPRGRAGLSQGRDTNRPSVESPDSSEALVIDDRSRVGPAQQVENKLRSLLGQAAVPLSHLRTRSLCVPR
jgi:hypothetical protein